MSAQPAEEVRPRPTIEFEVTGYEQDFRDGNLPARIGHFLGAALDRASDVGITRYEPKEAKADIALSFVGQTYAREMSPELRRGMATEIERLLGGLAAAQAREEAIVLPLGAPEAVDLYETRVTIEQYGAAILGAITQVEERQRKKDENEPNFDPEIAGDQSGA